jgi:hypothetical protein
MKHSIRTIYSIFVLIFFSLFFQSSGFWQLTKYLLLIIVAYVLYKKTIVQATKMKMYHFMFLSTTIVYVLFRSLGYDSSFTGITILLTIASIIGMASSGPIPCKCSCCGCNYEILEKEKKASEKIKKVEAKTVAKKTPAKTTKTVKKETATKKEAKTKTPAKKTTTKNTNKTGAKKKTTVNTTKAPTKKTTKKTTTKQ